MSFHTLLRTPLSLSLALLAIAAACIKKGGSSEVQPKPSNRPVDADSQQHAAELTRLSRHLLTVGEEEKARIARALHDGLGSTLTAVNMDLSWIQQRLTDQPALATRLARAREVLASTVEMKRRLIHELRPAALDSLGLSAALESHALDFSKSHSIPIETDLPDELPALTTGTLIALFRIYQEALTNAARHAQATSVKISLREEGASLVLEVSDNGIGFDRKAGRGITTSIGLLNMRERAAAIGATLSIEDNAPGSGTVVRVVLPRVDAKISTLGTA